jgi:hypothetical protein
MYLIHNKTINILYLNIIYKYFLWVYIIYCAIYSLYNDITCYVKSYFLIKIVEKFNSHVFKTSVVYFGESKTAEVH